MPQFEIAAGEDGVTIQLSPADPASTNHFWLPKAGMSISVADGAHADASTLTAVCTGQNGAPALLLQADEDDVVFQVDPAPPGGVAVFGPLAAADAPAQVPAGGAGTTAYTVSCLTHVQARAMRLVA